MQLLLVHLSLASVRMTLMMGVCDRSLGSSWMHQVQEHQSGLGFENDEQHAADSSSASRIWQQRAIIVLGS